MVRFRHGRTRPRRDRADLPRAARRLVWRHAMETGDLAGRAALLTGASGGIGLALARRLIEAGLRVALAYHAHPEAVHHLVARAAEAGVAAVALAGDLADARTP